DGAGGVLGDGSVYSQAKETFTKIKHLVDAAGGTMNDVVRLDIYVTDIKQREEVWRARREFFTGDFPVSTLVEVRALATPKLVAVAQHAERRHHLGVLLERRARALHGALLSLVDAHAEAEDQILAEPERSTVPSRRLLVVAHPALDQLFRRGRDDALDAVTGH